MILVSPIQLRLFYKYLILIEEASTRPWTPRLHLPGSLKHQSSDQGGHCKVQVSAITHTSYTWLVSAHLPLAGKQVSRVEFTCSGNFPSLPL